MVCISMNSFIDTLDVFTCKAKLPYKFEFAYLGPLVWSTVTLLPLRNNSDLYKYFIKAFSGLIMQGILEQVEVLSFPVERSQTAHDRWEMALDGPFRPWFGCGHSLSRCRLAVRLSRCPHSHSSGLSRFPRSRRGGAPVRWAWPVGGSGLTWFSVPPPACPPCWFLPQRPAAVAQPRTGTGGRSGGNSLPAGRDRPPQRARDRRQFRSRGLEPSQIFGNLQICYRQQV
ncbi:ras-related protein Rab-9A isoform X2 [Serinus canaria]|uniref:ras-related protein Rab-9A isoform X2 n=1 Tax=Serinus canaria TaxID=9135 RepID=UPI0021CD02B9|nr:ras-related protein Rab-9A isoform X2 [Serinus canaria]